MPDPVLPNPACHAPLRPGPVLVLHDAGVRLSGRQVLHGVTLTLREPRIGIVGRNGSGKTTLLRLLAGLVTPSSGHVRICRAPDAEAGNPEAAMLDPARDPRAMLDPARDPRAMLAAVGILFQNPDHQILFPTVAEELAFGLVQMGRSRAQAARAVADLLAAEGRSHWADAPISTLSHGQKHYLCLLAVLLMQPATLLLDEPFAGLDLPTQARLARRLAGVPQQVITITHDPAAVAGVDRVIWLEAGRVVADGAPGAVLPDFAAAMALRGARDADTDLAG